MYLLVNPAGSKLWRLKYRIREVERKLALGAYPDVSLSDARTNRDAALTVPLSRQALLKLGKLDAIKIGRRTLLTTASIRKLAQPLQRA